jgi:hypothetical protein
MTHATTNRLLAFGPAPTAKTRVKTYDVTVNYEAAHKQPDVIEVPYVNSAREAERKIIDSISVQWQRGQCLWGKFTVKAKLRSIRYV